MAKLLTAEGIKKIKPIHRRLEIRDLGSPDTGLYLHVQARGKDGRGGGGKSFVLLLRDPHPDKPGRYKSSKLWLGSFDATGDEAQGTPVLGTPLTLASARSLALEIARRRTLGHDVIAERRAIKDAQLSKTEKGESTFAAVASKFVAEYARPELRRWKETAHYLGLDYTPDSEVLTIIPDGLADRWRGRDVTSITSDDVYRVINETKRRGIPGLPCRTDGISNSRGRAMSRTLSKVFGWALQHRIIKASPSVGVFVPPASKARERVLTESEIIWFWKTTDELTEPFGAMFKLLLLTGCRLREIAKMRRADLSEDGETLTVPGARTKNRRPHVVPLAPLARDILTNIKQTSAEYVFSTTGRTPVAGFSNIKERLDELMTEEAAKDDVTWSPDETPFVIHDLRRTVATMMQESPPRGLGIAPHIVEAILNHVSGHKAGVAGVYNKAAYLPEKRAALERWARFIDGLISGRKANVALLRQRKAK
jgi:integrase